MTTFVIFIVCLILLSLLFAMKSFEIYHGRKIFLEQGFSRCDSWICRVTDRVRYWWGHVNAKNTSLIFFWLIVNIKKLIITVKRRFDHEPSHFFTKKDGSQHKTRGSVSFFLKDVSDYKKKLRDSQEK